MKLAAWGVLWAACTPHAEPAPPAVPPDAGPSVRVTDGVVQVRSDTALEVWVAQQGQAGCAPDLLPCVPLLHPVRVELLGPQAGVWAGRHGLEVAPGAPVHLVWITRSPDGDTASDDVVYTAEDGSVDADEDGLILDDELLLATDPANPDTDGGGIPDGVEHLALHDPLDPADDIPWEQDCADGADDDANGLIDGCDPACPGAPCEETACGDGRDDDHNGLADCEDAACAADPVCTEVVCDDGLDDDHDGAFDCADEDCWSGGCADTVIHWIVSTSTRSRSFTRHQHGSWADSGSSSWSAGPTTGKTLLVQGGVAQTCTWTVSHAWQHRDTPAYTSIAFHTTTSGRTGFVAAPGCQLTERALPPVGQLRWAYPRPTLHSSSQPTWSTSYNSYTRRWSATDGDRPGAQAFGVCPNRSAPTLRWRDDDGDGFGVYLRDLDGVLGGPSFSCDPLRPGETTAVGDCDDGDLTWNPTDVVLTTDADRCAGVTRADQDGDGVPAAADPDDRDPTAR